MQPLNLLKQASNPPTLEETMSAMTGRSRFSWTAAWWRFGKIIIQVDDGSENGKSWEEKGRNGIKAIDMPTPANLKALGCGGLSHTGRTDWIGYDLDVQHGKKHAYQTTEEAVEDAMRFCEKKQPYAWEVRLSRSGLGVHVRCMLKTPLPPGADVAKAAKDYMGTVWMKVDPVVMGRQAMWLYDSREKPDGFKLIGEKMW